MGFMRKILALAACGVASSMTLTQQTLVNTEIPSNSGNTPKRKIGPQNDYDFYLSKLKNYSAADQCKLSPVFKTRAEHLAALKDPSKTFDVLIIGGGCNGGGTLLEGSTRGLCCALIDRGDFASETSSRSTKLIHGGVRYLQEVFRLERGAIEKFKLVVEGLDERNFMLNTAPYMNKKIEMVIPCSGALWLVYYYIGASLYHFLSYFKWKLANYTYKLPRPKFVSKSEMQRLFPLLLGTEYGVKFCEGQMNDARLMIQTVLTSTQEGYVPGMRGATVANYVEFVDLLKDKEGRCIGARLKDLLDESIFEVKAKAIVNCAGIFADSIRKLDNPKVTPRIVASRGVHITFPHKYTPNDVGILIPKTSDGRVMFILPYRGYTLAGTTDHKCRITSAPVAPESDVKEIVDELSNYFDGDIAHECSSAWCGIRPLVLAKLEVPTKAEILTKVLMRFRNADNKANTKSLTRNHEVEVTPSGLVSLMGGKWTSYRRMGQDTIDAVLRDHPEIKAANQKSVTRELRLIGGYTTKTLDKTEKNIHDFVAHYRQFIHEKYKLDSDIATHLLELYGANAIKLANFASEENLNERIHKELPIIKAQVVYAIRNELATNVRDVVFRRLGIGFMNTKMAEEIIPAVADLMAKELNWDEQHKGKEIEMAKKNLASLG